jgi:hypothetical protein
MLYGPYANAGRVTLDPLPTMASEGTVALVSLDRFDSVVGLLATMGRARGRATSSSVARRTGSAPTGGGSVPFGTPAGRGTDGLLGTRTESE